MAHDEFFTLAKAEMLARNPLLREETIDLDGSTQNGIAHAIAICADEVEHRRADEVDGLYLDTATGDKLTRLVADRYGIQRHGTTAAVVTLTLSRTDDEEIEIPAGSIFATTGGIRFATDEAVEWPALDTADKTVTATAVTVGPETNVEAGAVTIVESALDDATVTVTNDEAATGGNDDETDEELKVRVRDTEARAVRGTGEAIRLGALTVARVRTASVYEAVDDDGTPTGGGVLVIADSAGAANAALVTEVEEVIKEYRPIGSYVDVTAGVPVDTTIVVTALWQAGQATAANRAALRGAIVARVNKLATRAAPTGADADSYADAVLDQGVISEVRPTVPGLIKVTLVTPSGATAPDQGECLRTRTALVTVS